MTECLSAAQRAQYCDEGYVVVPDVLSPDVLAEARGIVDELVERSRGVTESDNVFDLDAGHSADAPRLRRIKDPVNAHPFFADLMRSAAVLDPVAALIGESLRFHSSKLNIKQGDDGSGIEWHQDYAFFPHTNDDLLACGIALDDSDEENGCLLVVPGSHRGPVFDHHQDGRFVGAVSGDHPALADAPIKAVPVPAGGMSLHHVRLLHGSARNHSGRQRRLLFFQYVAADSWPLTFAPILDFPPLGALNKLVVRGEPSARARLVDITVDLPQFGGNYGSIYEAQETLARPAFNRTEMQ